MEKKKIIIITVSILIVIMLLTLCTVLIIIPEKKKNEKYNSAIEYLQNNEYEEAYNVFSELVQYKDSEEYKNNCVEKAKEKISADMEAEDYESALSGCEFVKKVEDITETYNKAMNSYIIKLRDDGESEKAYELLDEATTLDDKEKGKVIEYYIVNLIRGNEVEKGIETLKNRKNDMTDDEVSFVLKEYIGKVVYRDYTYNSLYSSMKNPSSLSINSVNSRTGLYYKDFNSYGKSGGKLGEDYSSNYSSDFPIFTLHVTINYRGTNSFGGTVPGQTTFFYMGRLNEDYSISELTEKLRF